MPRVVSQKEDVLYIKNPASTWGFNRVLNFTHNSGAAALTLSL